jgi:hypothetical protein
VNWIDLTQYKVHWRAFIIMVLHHLFPQNREFLGQLNNYQLLKEDSAP